MDEQTKNEWVTALRSGKYTQGKGFLKKVDPASGAVQHCCLGVLCELKGALSTVSVPEKTGSSQVLEVFPLAASKYNEARTLSLEYGTSAILRTATGVIPGVKDEEGWDESLASLNDAGWSFDRIADLIEENWQKL